MTLFQHVLGKVQIGGVHNKKGGFYVVFLKNRENVLGAFRGSVVYGQVTGLFDRYVAFGAVSRLVPRGHFALTHSHASDQTAFVNGRNRLVRRTEYNPVASLGDKLKGQTFADFHRCAAQRDIRGTLVGGADV